MSLSSVRYITSGIKRVSKLVAQQCQKKNTASQAVAPLKRVNQLDIYRESNFSSILSAPNRANNPVVNRAIFKTMLPPSVPESVKKSLTDMPHDSMGDDQETQLSLYKQREFCICQTHVARKVLSRILKHGDILRVGANDAINTEEGTLYLVDHSNGAIFVKPLNNGQSSSDEKIQLDDFLEQIKVPLPPGSRSYDQRRPDNTEVKLTIYQKPFLSANTEEKTKELVDIKPLTKQEEVMDRLHSSSDLREGTLTSISEANDNGLSDPLSTTEEQKAEPPSHASKTVLPLSIPKSFEKALTDMSQFRWVPLPYDATVRYKTFDGISYMFAQSNLDAMKGCHAIGNCVDAALCFSLFASVYSQDLSTVEANDIIKTITTDSMGYDQEQLLLSYEKREFPIRQSHVTARILSRMLKDGDILRVGAYDPTNREEGILGRHWVVYSDGAVFDKPFNNGQKSSYEKIPLAVFLEQMKVNLQPGGGYYDRRRPEYTGAKLTIFKNPILSGNKEK